MKKPSPRPSSCLCAEGGAARERKKQKDGKSERGVKKSDVFSVLSYSLSLLPAQNSLSFSHSLFITFSFPLSPSLSLGRDGDVRGGGRRLGCFGIGRRRGRFLFFFFLFCFFFFFLAAAARLFRALVVVLVAAFLLLFRLLLIVIVRSSGRRGRSGRRASRSRGSRGVFFGRGRIFLLFLVAAFLLFGFFFALALVARGDPRGLGARLLRVPLSVAVLLVVVFVVVVVGGRVGSSVAFVAGRRRFVVRRRGLVIIIFFDAGNAAVFRGNGDFRCSFRSSSWRQQQPQQPQQPRQQQPSSSSPSSRPWPPPAAPPPSPPAPPCSARRPAASAAARGPSRRSCRR